MAERAEFKPYAPGKEKPRGEIPPELKKYVPQVQEYIDTHTELFHTITGDRSVGYRPGHGFYIDLEGGEISIGVEQFAWAEALGLSYWQKVFSSAHELMHFVELREYPQEVLGHFEYLEKRAKQLAPRALEIWQKKAAREGVEMPSYLSEPVAQKGKDGKPFTYAEAFLYQKLQRELYNAMWDKYINHTVKSRAGVFSGSQAPEVERLYRDYLFPTDVSKRGEPPQPMEATDYTGIPKSSQLTNYLLRKQMVPNQEILIDTKVRTIINGYADATAKRHGITLEKEVELIHNPSNKRAANVGWRGERIRQTVEPHFIDLLMQDLDELDFPPPPVKTGGEGEEDKKGEKKGTKDNKQQGKPNEDKNPQPDDKAGKPNPWDSPMDKMPDPIDIDKVRDFIKQQKEKAKKDEAKRQEEDLNARLTPEERDARAQRDADRRISEEYNIDPKFAEEYRELEKSITPYKKELGEVFEQFMNTLQQQVAELWTPGFRTGRFNFNRLLTNAGPLIAAERPDLLAWETLSIYEQRDFISRIELLPHRITVRLALDGSGSMTEERLLALKQLSVLICEGLSSFEESMNLRFQFKEPFFTDVEIRMYGSRGESVIVKTSSEKKLTYRQELADRFKALSAIHNQYGQTCDAEPIWNITDAISPKHEEQIRKRKAKDILFDVTDGGSNQSSARNETVSPEQDTRDAIHAYEQKGGIARGLQIGTPEPTEQIIFDRIWGKNGSRVPHPKDLAPTVRSLFSDEILKINFLLSIIDDDEN